MREKGTGYIKYEKIMVSFVSMFSGREIKLGAIWV